MPGLRRQTGAGRSGLFGLSTRKVFHASFVAIGAVGSYSTFSPFPILNIQIG